MHDERNTDDAWVVSTVHHLHDTLGIISSLDLLQPAENDPNSELLTTRDGCVCLVSRFSSRLVLS